MMLQREKTSWDETENNCKVDSGQYVNQIRADSTDKDWIQCTDAKGHCMIYEL